MTSKMLEFHLVSLIISLSTVFAVVSNAHTPKGEREFYFMKAKTGDAFDFKYDTDNGTVFQGTTLGIGNSVHIMMGADNVLYWVKIDPEEFEGRQSVAKIVQPGGNDKEISFQDDFFTFMIAVSIGHAQILPYATRWDLKNICFTKSNTQENLFDYTISSTNNARKYNGTTYSATDDPFVQVIHIEDRPQLDGFYEVMVTEAEIASNNTFCKSISKLISESGSLGTFGSHAVDVKAIQSLVG